MGMSAGRTGSWGHPLRWATLLALGLIVLRAHLPLSLRHAETDQDRIGPAPGPAGPRIVRLPHSVDEDARAQSRAPAPGGDALKARMMDPRAAVVGTRDYQEAYLRGRAEADAQLEQGRATVYLFGSGMMTELTDRRTGLPLQWIGGCAIDAKVVGRMDGHNDRLEEQIRAHGLPANSFKRWENELFDLKTYCAARPGSEGPHPLFAGGPALKSPDGAVAIRPVTTRREGPDGRRGDRLGIVVVGKAPERPAVEVAFDRGRSEVFWGPDGSGFAVIRCRGADRDRYMALDLKGVRWLRFEPGDDDSVRRVGVGTSPPGLPSRP
jgi:hypothetical protein